ncbi:MAG: sulfite exporter TauE/SafE family protein [Celeribacter sp.]|jgi:uncharacterized membrane protein YfcA
MTEIPFALIGLAAFMVGLSKGGLVSISSLAVPLLAIWIDPITAAALLLPIYLISDAVGVWLYRRDYSAWNLKLLIPAGFAGVILGTMLEPVVPSSVFTIAVGLIGLAYCLRAWFITGRDGPARAADVPRGIFWGVLTGMASFISHSGGPPWQTYVLPQKLPKLVFAGTTTIAFAAINLAKVPAYLSVGALSHVDWQLTSLLAVAGIFGTVCGRWAARAVSDQHYLNLIQGLLFVLSIRLIWQGGRDLAALAFG